MNRPRPHQHHAPRVWIGIAIAGGGGSLLRYLIASGGGWSTILLANALGCAVLGWLVARGRATPALAVGFCGGLTTFSGVAAQAYASARGTGPGAFRAAGDLAPHDLIGALLLLAINGLVGLGAFLLARRAGGGGPQSAAPPTAGPIDGIDGT